MHTLRVLLPAPPDPARTDAWALFDGAGRLVEHGRGAPSQWPAAERREAVIDADAIRIVTLALPPLPRDRLVAAATFALEDRLATPVESAAVVVGERDRDGRVRTFVVGRDLADALRDAPFARAIAEPELADTTQGWRWCEGEHAAFVRTDAGDAFSVSRASDDSLPPELVVALAQAQRDGRVPQRVIADRRVEPPALAQWHAQTGVAFVAGQPWQWHAMPPQAFAAATDLLSRLRRRTPAASATTSRRFAFALALAALALGVHVIAALATWGWQRVSLARLQNVLVGIAHGAGARDATAGNAVAAVARLHADARHRAGLAANDDAMPLLARAAPALAALPAGALKSATWAGGAWTLDLAPMEDGAIAAFTQRLTAAGVTALLARTASGVRARVTAAS